MENLFSNLLHEWLWPILQFVVGFGIVIFVHEVGHFIVAKAVGIRVEEFALGFGTRLFGFRRGETGYCVNILPMGGYVKLAGQKIYSVNCNACHPGGGNVMEQGKPVTNFPELQGFQRFLPGQI